ncbi:MAG TPA: hypothetical protein VFD88_02670, partial [Clostridia bacterium]|nr:hypothetical protein [Clostridia bacterium]
MADPAFLNDRRNDRVTGATPAFAELPLGAIRPTGWLLDQLRLQAAGQTGQLEDIWADVGP